MKYAIIYLAIPFAETDDLVATSQDAEAMGELVLRVVQTTAPIQNVTLIGTRLTRNNLVAPSCMSSRLENKV